MTRPFRFGIQMSQPAAGLSWADTARKVEDLGYSSLLLPDHFGDQLAVIPAMMNAADATTTLKVGALVFDNDYRHPVVLAKDIATVDLLSGGRVEFGLGAGWMRTDYEQAGMDYGAPGVRVSRFEEAIKICKGLFAEGAVTHEGAHYRINGLDGLPKPATVGGPPLLIGGGAKRVLSIAGREADIISINPNMVAGEVNASTAKDAMADAVDQKLEWVRTAAGDRYGDIEISATLFFVSVTDDAATTAEGISSMFGVSGPDVLGSPIIAVGSTDQIADGLRAKRERWDMSYILCQGDALDAFAPMVAALAGTRGAAVVDISIGGAGWAGTVHALAAAATGRVRVRAVASRDPDHAGNVASVVNADVLTFAELPVGKELVIVATPPVHHHELARRSIDVGNAVLIEKPLCVTLDEADDLIAAVTAAGTVAGYAENLLFAPIIELARARILALGPLRHLELRCAQPPPTGATSSSPSPMVASCTTSAPIPWRWHSRSPRRSNRSASVPRCPAPASMPPTITPTSRSRSPTPATQPALR